MPQIRVAVHALRRALERATTSSSRLHPLSRAQDGTMVDLREVLRSGFGIAATSMRTAGLDVRLDLPSVPVPFLGDGEMLERVVVDLVDNAIKLTPAGGRVDVSLTAGVDEVVLAVIDTGIGIPADEQELLFTRAVVERHDGTVRVDSAVGVGTTFEVRLPRRRPDRLAAAGEVRAAEVPQASMKSGMASGRPSRQDRDAAARVSFEQLFPAASRRR